MKISRDSIPAKITGCGELRELFLSENMSIAYVKVKGKTEEHFHNKILEIYYIEKGAGILVLDGNEMGVEEGDLIVIPPRTKHFLKAKEMELLVITQPRWREDDYHRV